jgi:hypothetical protein
MTRTLITAGGVHLISDADAIALEEMTSLEKEPGTVRMRTVTTHDGRTIRVFAGEFSIEAD